MRHIQTFLMLGLLFLAPLTVTSKIITTFYTVDNLPLRHFVAGEILISGSDSLAINQQKLTRDDLYRFNQTINAFEFNQINLEKNDTLFIKYITAPGWLKSFYGRRLPQVDVNGFVERPDFPVQVGESNRYKSRVDFLGSKTFRVSSNNANSNFGQSLDLKIDGELTEKIKINGAISDRGYQSEYGTFNGRINELDKIKLRLYSDVFRIELGETSYPSYSGSYNKPLSGLSFNYDDRKLNLFSVIARPKGKFESIMLNGVDSRQGPYQISANGRFQPVVSGSEEIWLDGALLKRGSLNDYTIDYSSGEITFSVNHPISSQSRIEIDYEPIETSYRQEFFGVGGGYREADSGYYVQLGFTREGDNKNDFLLDNFDDNDRQLLETVGDNSDLAIRSGVAADTLGSYMLVVDSLPDSVYQYVGENLGDYSVNFTYLGEKMGSYRFTGGGRYLYVGDSLGEYMPIVRVPLPQKTDYLSINSGINNEVLGNFDIQINLSSFDRNLLSDINDGDNQSWAGKIDWYNDWTEHIQVIAKARHQDNNFKSKERIFEPDVARKFYAPDNQIASDKRTLYDILTKSKLSSTVRVEVFLAEYNYGQLFDANQYGLELRLKPKDNSYISNKFAKTIANYNSAGSIRDGEENNYIFDSQIKLDKKWFLNNSYDFHRRTNDYFDFDQKIITHRLNSEIIRSDNKLGFEYYNEDSTVSINRFDTKRSTIYLNLNEQYKNYTLSTQNSIRHIKTDKLNETVLLNRLKLNYNNSRRQLNWGTDYLMSSETRNSRGITYLKVTEGTGDYIFEDGIYIRDLNGDYIRVEEILSDQSKVKRGEKSFYLSKSSSDLMFRFQSDLEEELMNNEKRKLLWVLPFYSDKNKAYFFFSRRYAADFKTIAIKGGYLVNFKIDWYEEGRTISGDLKEKRDWQGEISLRQAYQEAYFEESMELFENKRDQYYNGGIDGKVNGYKLALNYIQQYGAYRLTSGTSYRFAKTDKNEDSKIIALIIKGQRQMPMRGEVRTELELYTCKLTVNSNSSIFLLTDNRPGKQGAIWNILLRYGLNKDLKINLNVNGRHADNRSARITGRAELVAGF